MKQSFDMGGRGTGAYDLRAFQTNTHAKSRNLTVRNPSRQAILRARAREKAAMVLRGLLAASLVVTVIVATLCSRVVLTELSTQISKSKAELESISTENIRLEAEVEAKLSARNVEEYATQKLGMSTLDKSQITYIKLNDGDEVELTESSPKAGILGQLKLALSSFL